METETKSVLDYELPLLRVLDLESEGVLCGSTESIGTNEGVWK